MEKILVTIYCLNLEEEYDVLIPINLKVTETLNIIQQTIRELSGENYQINPNALLYDENGKLINVNNIVRFSGLKNGCKVLLK